MAYEEKRWRRGGGGEFARRAVCAGVIGSLLLSAATELGSETLVMTATYPSPVGIYARIITTGGAGNLDTILSRNNSNVGIGTGTTAPAAKLHVMGNTRVDGLLRVRSAAGGGNLDISDNGGGTATINNSGNSYLNIGSAVSTNFTTGNVGIGTASPPYKLQVMGNVGWPGYTLQPNSWVPWANLNAFPPGCPAGQYVNTIGGTLTCGSLPGPPFTINAMTGPAFTIAAGGSIVISNSPATNTVTISNAAAPGIAGTGSANYVAKWTGSSSLGTGVIYDNGANVGIGTTSPGMKLDVQGGNIRVGRTYFGDTAYGYNCPGLGSDGVNTGVCMGGGGSFYVENSAGALANTYGNDYWIQAANGGAGQWASQLGGGGGGGFKSAYGYHGPFYVGPNVCGMSYTVTQRIYTTFTPTAAIASGGDSFTGGWFWTRVDVQSLGPNYVDFVDYVVGCRNDTSQNPTVNGDFHYLIIGS